MRQPRYILKLISAKFALACVLTLGIIGPLQTYYKTILNNNSNESQSTLSIIESTQNPIKVLLDLLNQNNIFLTDINKLKEIEIYKNSTNLEVHFDKYFQSPNVPSFGIFFENLKEFLAQANNVKNLVITQHYGSSKNRSRSSLILLKLENSFQIEINVFYKRNEFLYVGNLIDSSNLSIKWFNDIPRAMGNFNLTSVYDSSTNTLKIPENLKQFFYEYNHSQFIECNFELAKHNFQQSNGTHYQHKKLYQERAPCLIHIKKKLESMYKSYWLTSGSLLGWYRDCGMVPYTTDADLSIFASEYEDNIKDTFLGDPIAPLKVTHGLKRKGYEFRLFGCGFTFDIFLNYRLNNKKQCSSYHGTKRVYSVCFPIITNLCSGEVFGNKFMVPCNVEEMLSVNYGNSWKSPISSKYSLPNINWQNGETRSDFEIPYLTRYYLKNGSIDTITSIKKVNELYSALNSTKKITKLPTNDNEYL